MFSDRYGVRKISNKVAYEDSFIFITTRLMAVHAQELEGDLLHALGDAAWGSDFTSSNDVPDIDSDPVDPQDQGNRTSEELNCNDSSERNTVPYKFLSGLLANKKMTISHDPHSGILSLKGGVMIGNCNAMLDTIVSKAKRERSFLHLSSGGEKTFGMLGGKMSI